MKISQEQLIKNYVRRRNRAVLKAVEEDDLSELKELSKEVGQKIPSDDVIRIAARKIMYHTASFSDKQRFEAARWLIIRGYSTDL